MTSREIRAVRGIDLDFIRLMIDLLQLGEKKYGKESFLRKIETGNLIRTPRLETVEMMKHSMGHALEVTADISHDFFGDIDHQLAAVAINPYIEFCLRKAERAK